MSRFVRIVAIAFALFAIAGSGIAAHDATPKPSLLASAGLPELHIMVTDAGFELPAEVPAGLTYVSVDNHSQYLAEAQFLMPSESTTPEALAAAFQSEGIRDWFYTSVWAGGPVAAPGATAGGVVDLSAGDWFVAQTDSEIPIAPVALKVTGEAEKAESGAVPSDVQVTAGGYKFDFPDELAVGSQVWEITNTDPVPHHVVLLYYPGAITVEDILAVDSMMMGTPAPDVTVNPELLEDAGFVPVHSQGQISWVEMNLKPGSYVAMCFISDQGADAPHAYMGMVDIFTVPGEVATPEA